MIAGVSFTVADHSSAVLMSLCISHTGASMVCHRALTKRTQQSVAEGRKGRMFACDRERLPLLNEMLVYKLLHAGLWILLLQSVSCVKQMPCKSAKLI